MEHGGRFFTIGVVVRPLTLMKSITLPLSSFNWPVSHVLVSALEIRTPYLVANTDVRFPVRLQSWPSCK
jgi:hypothetical protein